MSAVQRLESLLERIQRNRREPAAPSSDVVSSSAAASSSSAVDSARLDSAGRGAPPRRKQPTPSPLQMAVEQLGGPSTPVASPALASDRLASDRPAAAGLLPSAKLTQPMTSGPQVARSLEIEPPTSPATAVPSVPTAPETIGAFASAPPSRPIVQTTGVAPVTGPMTFGELLGRSLALRP